MLFYAYRALLRTILHFRISLRANGGAEIDFNVYLVHPSGKVEIVF
jgi:hypothetical protein